MIVQILIYVQVVQAIDSFGLHAHAILICANITSKYSAIKLLFIIRKDAFRPVGSRCGNRCSDCFGLRPPPPK